MPLLKKFRQIALTRAFGTGAGAMVASAVTGWFIDQVRESLGSEPERLDTTQLQPGESYLVTTRPAMSRKEAKLASRQAAAKAQLAKVTRTTASARRTALKLNNAQRKAARAKAGSARQLRHERDALLLGARFDRLTAATTKQRRLEATIASLDTQLEGYRRAALAETPRKRPSRTKVFR